MEKLRIGTRGSALALKQADIVRSRLCSVYPEIQCEIITILTTGDRITDKNLATIGGKGLFIKEIEEELNNGSIDIAVHSMKDMPAIMPERFDIPCVIAREDPHDAFLAQRFKCPAELPEGATIGTSSARRAAQMLHIRPDLIIVPLRGNINTRIAKLDSGLVDATFLAIAGLRRVGLAHNDGRFVHVMPYDEMLPAVSQGAIGIEILTDNIRIRELLLPLNHHNTYTCLDSERSFMRVFEGSCATPIAALAEIHGDVMTLRCLIARPDGQVIYRTSRSGSISDAAGMGEDAALQLKSQAGDNFFA